MEIFQLISQFLQFLASWFPHLVHIDVRYLGVRFVRGKDATLALPGMRVYWPLTTDLVVWPVISRTLILESQSLRTSDNVTVALKLRLLYTVDDAVLLLTSLHEPDDSIRDLALGAATEVICNHTLDELTADIRQTNRNMLLETRKPLEKVGLRVSLSQLASLAPAVVIQHYGELPVRRSEEDYE